jgi:hypothetical protein
VVGAGLKSPLFYLIDMRICMIKHVIMYLISRESKSFCFAKPKQKLRWIERRPPSWAGYGIFSDGRDFGGG